MTSFWKRCLHELRLRGVLYLPLFMYSQSSSFWSKYHWTSCFHLNPQPGLLSFNPQPESSCLQLQTQDVRDDLWSHGVEPANQTPTKQRWKGARAVFRMKRVLCVHAYLELQASFCSSGNVCVHWWSLEKKLRLFSCFSTKTLNPFTASTFDYIQFNAQLLEMDLFVKFT